MQNTIRLINTALGPILTLLLALRFRAQDLGPEWSAALAAAVAGVVVICIELILERGPRHFAVLRRWLDPRAAFEGVWLQEVFDGPAQNSLGVFTCSFSPKSGTFAVDGNAYSIDGTRWATWHSTKLFFGPNRPEASYLWDGEQVGNRELSEQHKRGFTTLWLRRGSALVGEGRVEHLREPAVVKFEMTRVTNQLLRGLGLPFGVRELTSNAAREELELVKARLSQRHGTPALSPVAT